MKIGIDGVLLGAWSPLDTRTLKILDVGTGSGLIALMLAQRVNDASIDAIDIDDGACRQAKINSGDSKWNDRIDIQQIDFEKFSSSTTSTYDLVVSNPPYFVDSLKAPDESRSKARHTDTLSHEALLQNAAKILKKTGRICVILPVTEGLQCVKSAENLSLFCYQCIYVHPKPAADAKRVLLEFGFAEQETIISTIEIETEQRHHYSNAFTALVKDFYLKL